jgi:hypothetical protein
LARSSRRDLARDHEKIEIFTSQLTEKKIKSETRARIFFSPNFTLQKKEMKSNLFKHNLPIVIFVQLVRFSLFALDINVTVHYLLFH